MRCRQNEEELNRELQVHGIKVLNLYTQQMECHPGYTKKGKLFITNGEGVIQSEVCEVNIEYSNAYLIVGYPSVYVRKSDLKRDPALYLWFASLESDIPYKRLLAVKNMTEMPADEILHACKEYGRPFTEKERRESILAERWNREESAAKWFENSL